MPRKKQAREPTSASGVQEPQIITSSNETGDSSLLPDEIVKEILCQSGLVISAEDFRNTDIGRSPFADSTHTSTSAALLVCKQWLRVATPLLYHTIVLRSKAQAQALEVALRRKNKMLGAYIKWMRLEGHYGAVMKNILDAASKLTDLYFPSSLTTHESASGLVKALPSLSPKRLILYNMDARHESSMTAPGVRTREFINALCDCIASKWESLESVQYDPGPFLRYPNNELAQAVSKAPNLHTVNVDSICKYTVGKWLILVSVNASLKTVSVQEQSGIQFRGNELVPRGGRIWKLLRVGQKTLDQIVAEEEQQKLRKSPCAKFNDKIWQLILQSALEITSNTAIDETASDEEYSTRTGWNEKRLQLLLTCKTFFRLGHRYLFSGLILSDHRGLLLLAEYLSQNPNFIKHVKFFALYTVPGPDDSEMVIWDRPPLQEGPLDVVEQMFAKARLISFGWHLSLWMIRSEFERFLALPWSTFDIICNSSSSTLVHLHPIRLDGPPTCISSFLSPFARLRNIRTLKWRSCDSCEVQGDVSNHVPADLFSNVEELDYIEMTRWRKGRITLLEAMVYMRLSSLRTVKFSKGDSKGKPAFQSFLAVHGKKITSLCVTGLDTMEPPFKHCPNLTRIVFETLDYESSSWESFFHCPFKHPSLLTIAITAPYITRRGYKTLEKSCMWNPSTYDSFPCLREINMADACQWPTTELETKNGNHWPERAEKLLEGNIKLTDGEGKHWKPRLKPRGQRKSKKIQNQLMVR